MGRRRDGWRDGRVAHRNQQHTHQPFNPPYADTGARCLGYTNNTNSNNSNNNDDDNDDDNNNDDNNNNHLPIKVRDTQVEHCKHVSFCRRSLQHANRLFDVVRTVFDQQLRQTKVSDDVIIS